ncbi:MAG: helix-turn-helix domain-containing protein [Pseudomonadota bacterium]
MAGSEGKVADPVYRYVGNRLRHYRRERGLKQAALAEVINVSPQQYQKYEDAQSKCSLTNLFKLAEFLGVDIHAIMPVGVDSYGEPARSPRTYSVQETPDDADGVGLAADGDLIARLVSSFLLIESVEAREHLVRFIEAMAKSKGAGRDY